MFDKRHFPVKIYFTLVTISFALNFPGRANSDSLVMFDHGRHPGWLIDWHSPTTSLLWSLLDPWMSQPASGLLIQCLLLLALPAYFLGSAISEDNSTNRLLYLWVRLTLSLVFAILCIYISGYVYKDVMLIAAIFLAAVSEAQRIPTNNTKTTTFTLLALALAYTIRPTNLLIFSIVAALFLLRKRLKFRKESTKAVLLAGLAVGIPYHLGSFANNTILKPQKSGVEASLIIFDIAGISKSKETNEFSTLQDWPSSFSQSPQDCYTAKWWDSFSPWGTCPEYFEEMKSRLATKESRAKTIRWWADTALQNPGAYLQHRFEFAKNLLYFKGDKNTYFNIDNTRPNLEVLQPDRIETYIEWKPSLRFEAIHNAWRFFTKGELGQPYMWLIFCIVGAAATYRNRAQDPHLSSLAFLCFTIGTANIVMLIFLGVAALPRYTVPSFFCSFAGLLFMLQSKLNKQIKHST